MKSNKKNSANASTKQRPEKINQQYAGKQAADNDADKKEGEDPNTAVKNNINTLDGVSKKYAAGKPKATPVSKRNTNSEAEDIHDENSDDEFADDNENEEDFDANDDEDTDDDIEEEYEE